MKQNKQLRPKAIVGAVCRRHHFSNPNTVEIVLSLLFIGIVSRVISFLGRDAKY